MSFLFNQMTPALGGTETHARDRPCAASRSLRTYTSDGAGRASAEMPFGV
ncbi:MAG TPA: hypothetical protein VIX73_37515 [Kofleriaceae bacterium]|jgi:hypothetical protein